MIDRLLNLLSRYAFPVTSYKNAREDLPVFTERSQSDEENQFFCSYAIVCNGYSCGSKSIGACHCYGYYLAYTPEARNLPDISKAGLGETTTELKENILKYGGLLETIDYVTLTLKYQDVEFEDCTMRFTKLEEAKFTRKDNSVYVMTKVYKFSFSFADIDSDKTFLGHVSNGAFNAVVHTHNQENKINEDYSFLSPKESFHKNDLIPNASVVFTDIDLVKRIGQAFRHVATLCNAQKAK